MTKLGNSARASLVTLFACALFAATPAVAADAGTVSVNGVTLNYVEQGSGTPVVFVHGSISDLRVFDGLHDVIAADFQFVAYTRRYFGTAPWIDNGETFSDATHAADLIAFVEALDRGPVHLVAHSGGGAIAMFAAMDRPDLFLSMVQLEPGGAMRQLLTTPEEMAAYELLRDAQTPANEASSAGDLARATELFLDSTNNRPGAFAGYSPELRQVHMDNARTLTLRATGTARPLDCDLLNAVSVPTAVVVSDHAWAYFDLVADATVRCLPDAEKITLADAYHDAPIVKPEAVGAVIISFVSAHDPQ